MDHENGPCVTSAEIWRLIVQVALALSSGVLLATLTRRWTKSDKSVEEQLSFKAAQMQSEAGYRDELREENKGLREELRAERENCDEKHDQLERINRAHELYILVLEEALKREGKPLPVKPESRAESA